MEGHTAKNTSTYQVKSEDIHYFNKANIADCTDIKYNLIPRDVPQKWYICPYVVQLRDNIAARTLISWSYIEARTLEMTCTTKSVVPF